MIFGEVVDPSISGEALGTWGVRKRENYESTLVFYMNCFDVVIEIELSFEMHHIAATVLDGP